MFEFVTDVVNELKNQYPTPVEIYVIESNEIELETGVITTLRSKIEVEKAVKLPIALQRKAEIRLEYGGEFDTSTSIILIDSRDLPDEFRFKLDYYVVMEGKRYEISAIKEDFGKGIAYVLVLKETEGVLPNRIIDAKVSSTFVMVQNVK